MTTMQNGKVTLEVNDRVGLLTLNDPGTLNAWGEKLKADFSEALDQIEAAGTDIRAVVLTGAGRGFSSGANLNDPDAPPRDREAEARGEKQTSLESYYHPMLMRLREFNVPLVSAVNGVAAGVGMSVALSCALVVMARPAPVRTTARISVPAASI